MAFDILNPKPQPTELCETLSNFLLSYNNFLRFNCSAGVIPIPLSVTETLILSLLFFIVILIIPFSVNLIEFETI